MSAARIVSDLVPSTAGQEGGYIVLRFTEPLVAQQLFGDFDQSFLSAVHPQSEGRTTEFSKS